VSPYRAVGFDYGGVVAGKPGLKAAAIQLLGVSPDAYTVAYFAHSKDLNLGKISMREFWQVVLGDLGRAHQIDALLGLVDEYWSNQLNPDILKIAGELRANNYITGIFSNYSANNTGFMRHLGLQSHFDVLMVSGEIGLAKPDPRAFEHFAHTLGVTTQELIFVDDSNVSLSTASQVGYYPILFTDADDLRDELTRLGVL
jgi:HAD superfamily hydrolase (TIGR01509 family)